MTPATRLERGTSLVELMAALSLALVTLVSVSSLFSQGLSKVHDASGATSGVLLAQEKLDEVLSTGEAHTDLAAGTFEEQLEAGFTRRWTVVVGGPGGDARTVVVTVERAGEVHARVVGLRTQ